MLRGELYRADDPELIAERRQAQILLARFNAIVPDGGWNEAGRQLLVELLAEFGSGAVIEPPFRCDYGGQIAIGARTFINYGATILDCAPVQIGADVLVGPNVQLLTATHPLDAGKRREGWEEAHPIVIGDGAWLGGGAIVCPGVTIGAETVVGAGSVVTRDLPPRVLAAGNPCRVIRSLDG